MTKEKLINEIIGWTVLAGIVVMALPSDVLAQAGTVGGSLETVQKQTTKIAPIVSVIAYTAGAFLGVAGALQLKTYSEQPQGAKLAPAIGKLGVAGALVALPSLLGTLTQSLGIANQTQTYAPLPAIQ